MIRSRSYVVPLLAVLLALATGVALGAGPLTGTRSSAEPGHAVAPPAPPRYPDAFAAAVATRLYAGGLSRKPVALVTMPGADPATVAALTAQVEAAGGRLTGTFPVGGQLVDPGQKSLVDTLGSQLRAQLHGHEVGRSASTYPRIGELLGVALANRGTALGQPGSDASVIRQSLVAAHLLGVPQGAVPTAPLVLVVLGRPLDQTIADGLLTGLAAGARAVVAVAPTRQTDLVGLQTDGVTRRVTTVDGTETPAGRVAAVLALIRAWHTRGGAFGASGSDGPVPLG